MAWRPGSGARVSLAAVGVDRQDIGSWLSGPRATLEAQGFDFGYRGQRLGLPQSGPGSLASFGRRAVAIFIDWIACTLVAHLFFPFPYGSRAAALTTLIVFAVVKWLFTCLGGASFGQRIMGIRVICLGRTHVDPGRAAIRTLLICLVVPAVIWDRDGRGVQDRLTGTAVVSARPSVAR